ncbi:MAG: CBS domain-containing protein [Colwellia sp.]
MNTQPAILNADMTIPLAMDCLDDKGMTSAPVCDSEDRLVGFLSAHDITVELWCEDYLPNSDKRVADIMTRDVISICGTEKLVNIVEFFCIDKEQVHPSASTSTPTDTAILSLAERVKESVVKKPQVLPVIENGKLVGLITRKEVLNALRPIFGEKINLVHASELVRESV